MDWLDAVVRSVVRARSGLANSRIVETGKSIWQVALQPKSRSISRLFTGAVGAVCGLIMVAYLSFVSAVVSAACRPFIALMAYMEEQATDSLLELAFISLMLTLGLQLLAVIYAGGDEKLGELEAGLHGLNIVGCFFLLAFQLFVAMFMVDYLTSAIRKLSPDCQQNSSELVWVPPSHGVLWQVSHAAWVSYQNGSYQNGSTRPVTEGYEYPEPVPAPLPRSP